MSVNKLVSINEAIQRSCFDMGIDADSHFAAMTLWAYDGERQIGSYYGWERKIAVLDVIGGIAKLPKGATRVQVVIMGDQGCENRDLFDNLRSCSSTNAFVSETGGTSFLVVDVPSDEPCCSTSSIGWEIQDNSIIFASVVADQKCTVQYLGFKEDSEGMLMVNENHLLAISYYIKMMFAERSRWSSNKMDLADIANFNNKWKQERGSAIAKDNVMSDSDRLEVVAMLHDPWGGMGLEVGMY